MGLNEASQRVGAYPANVVRNLAQEDSNRAHSTGELDQTVAVNLSLEVVLSFLELLGTGELNKLLGNLGAEISRGV